MVVAAALAMLCTGCGNKASDEQMKSDSYYEAVMENTEASYTDDVAEEMDEMYSSADEELADNGLSATANTGTDSAPKLDKEMLVYRGELSIDTLDFDTSVNDFKTLLNQKGGFVESESYSDSYSTSGYYAVDNNRKHNLYYATVRVPSTEYDAIINAATTLGDVRSRCSDATNVTQQYSTYKSQLEIYEAEYARYLTLLESATDDEYALQIENELFDIQMEIARLKSGITNIENDVAYSYIDITIKEVKEYEEDPEPTDTFGNRFKNTCRQSWQSFLKFLENTLFFVIRNIYGIVVIVVIIIVIKALIKKRKAKRNRKEESSNPAQPVQDSESEQEK